MTSSTRVHSRTTSGTKPTSATLHECWVAPSSPMGPAPVTDEDGLRNPEGALADREDVLSRVRHDRRGLEQHAEEPERGVDLHRHSPTAQLGDGTGAGRRTMPTTRSPLESPLAGPAASTRPWSTSGSTSRSSPHLQSAAQAGGDLSSEVFARLERGEGAVKIVTDLRVHPGVVDGLMKRWERFKRTILLSREDIYASEDALEMRVRDFTAECIVDRIRRTAARMAKCVRCNKERPYICSTCVSDRIERCEWCKHRPKHVCTPCLDQCVRRALARHGIMQEQGEEEEEEKEDDGNDKEPST